MIRLRIGGLCALALVNASARATPTPPREWAISTRVEFLGLGHGVDTRIGHLLMGAVELADAFAPREPHLFNTSVPRDPAKALRLIVMDSRKMTDLPELGSIDAGTRSAAFYVRDARGSTLNLVFFADRLLLKSDGRTVNQSAFADLTLELVRHVFGLVEAYRQSDHPGGWATASRDRDAERTFVRRLMDHPIFTALEPDVRRGFAKVRDELSAQDSTGCGPELGLKH